MRLAAGLAAVVLAGLAAGAATGARPGGAASGLRAFDGCPSFLTYVRAQALPLVGPYGLGGGSLGMGALPPAAARGDKAAVAATPEFSGTNVQEEGVDEPDLVKTNGRTLFVVSSGRVTAVDVRSGRPRALSSVRLAAGWQHELLLHDDRLLVLSQGSGGPIPIDGIRARF